VKRGKKSFLAVFDALCATLHRLRKFKNMTQEKNILTQ